MISQFIQHNSQRINIYPVIIGFSFIHFRGHIGKGSFLGKTAGAAVQLPGNSKIPQLEFPES